MSNGDDAELDRDRESDTPLAAAAVGLTDGLGAKDDTDKEDEVDDGAALPGNTLPTTRATAAFTPPTTGRSPDTNP